MRRNRHRRLLRGVLALGALFLAAFVLTRGNPNAGLFLFLAVVCVGLAVVFLFAQTLPRFRGTILDRTGSEEDPFLGGLLLIALLTPWSVAVPTLQHPQTFGWQSPLPLLIIAALVLARLRRSRRGGTLAVVMAGVGLAAWFGWVAAQLLTSTFRATGFPFLPIDLLGEGWYVGLLACAVSVDGMAAAASEDDRPARPREVWPFALVPGMGLTRLHYPGRGRLWLVATAFFAFLVQANCDRFGGIPVLRLPRQPSAASPSWRRSHRAGARHPRLPGVPVGHAAEAATGADGGRILRSTTRPAWLDRGLTLVTWTRRHCRRVPTRSDEAVNKPLIASQRRA